MVMVILMNMPSLPRFLTLALVLVFISFLVSSLEVTPWLFLLFQVFPRDKSDIVLSGAVRTIPKPVLGC